MPTNQESMVGMKKDLTKQRQGDVNMPTIDVKQLADQVYQVIERKITIERQRRGMF
jgi:alpha-D-ribose 1-methylphosphonate 5-triphosphate synthase subunit PhnI